MQRVFHKQTEAHRRLILNALLAIGSGRSVPFFSDTYNSSTSSFTRRTALRCLWMSGAKGKAVFEGLKQKADDADRILFQHVESPIINYDGV